MEDSEIARAQELTDFYNLKTGRAIIKVREGRVTGIKITHTIVAEKEEVEEQAVDKSAKKTPKAKKVAPGTPQTPRRAGVNNSIRDKMEKDFPSDPANYTFSPPEKTKETEDIPRLDEVVGEEIAAKYRLWVSSGVDKCPFCGFIAFETSLKAPHVATCALNQATLKASVQERKEDDD